MSSHESHRIAKALLVSPTEGVVELTHDWRAQQLPRISLEGSFGGYLKLEPLAAKDFARESRYYIDGKGNAAFVFDKAKYPRLDYNSVSVYVGGSFNGWQDGVGEDRWLLRPDESEGKDALVLRVPMDELGDGYTFDFKFVTEDHQWLPVDGDAPNVGTDGAGNLNFRLSTKRSGRHRFGFRFHEPLDLSERYALIYHSRIHNHRIALEPGPFFYQLGSDKELGAIVEGNRTLFRLFAPRAKWVKVGIRESDQEEGRENWILMSRSDDYVWEAEIARDLHGAFYWFRLDGPDGESGAFDSEFKILDPYAKATVGREGPGIVVDLKRYGAIEPYNPPNWQDLVVLEAHTRDLIAGLPEHRNATKPLGFRELQSYVESDDFYPSRLGVNAIELQPIQENDSESREAYHWGYMTANYFSPASSYASDPGSGSQIEEFRSLVSSFHRRGLAVILDVVYNHVGEPAHLMFVDKLYYFHVESGGGLTNWSGCGNDLRCDTPMARRLLVESLKHLVLFYGVDGFRFDLADLVGKAALVEIEEALKAVKPDVILIAEPWSFRGHIGRELRDTGYASWNDGYREGVKAYIQGNLSPGELFHLIQGSPDDYASWPAQTVNYTESHDDRVWIDVITENSDFNGSVPTINDLRRTHMMAAILMASIGIPMVHAGQDFLFSKHGVNNTYQRGDLNALNYERRLDYGVTAAYFRGWLAFRRSELGSLLRHYSRAGDGFFETAQVDGRNGLAVLFNADRSQGPYRLLFAVNPEAEPLHLPIPGWETDWIQIAGHDRFLGDAEETLRCDIRSELRLPPLGAGLWKSRD